MRLREFQGYDYKDARQCFGGAEMDFIAYCIDCHMTLFCRGGNLQALNYTDAVTMEIVAPVACFDDIPARPENRPYRAPGRESRFSR